MTEGPHDTAAATRGRRLLLQARQQLQQQQPLPLLLLLLQARLSGDGQSSTAHVSHVATSVSGPSDSRGPSRRRLGRTPSSPSVLLSKVKERIREKVRRRLLLIYALQLLDL